jgi:hypothetical protein
MNKQAKTFFIFLGVWIIASFLNGFSSGICISIFCPPSHDTGAGYIALAVLLSFVLSAPLVGLLWLFSAIAISTGKKGDLLFQFILKAALVLALLGAVFFVLGLGNEFKEARYAVGFCILISAISPLLFFRKQLKTDE